MAKIFEVITHPNEILRKKSKGLSKEEINSKEIKEFVLDMGKTMLEKDGVGLAAPQIGKNIRLFVVNTKDGVIAMFNPEITKKSFITEWDIEGCLSVPNTFGKVKRPRSIKCLYTSDTGEQKEIKAKGLFARVIQHELDHLNGILFIDKAKNITHENT